MTNSKIYKIIASVLVLCLTLTSLGATFAADTKDGNFVAKEFITRAEFLTMAVAALEVEGSGGHRFSDVPAGAYYKSSLDKAVSAGVINGKSSGVFAPEDTLTHQEAATIIVKALEKVRGKQLSVSGALANYADGNQVDSWAQEAMEKAATFKIIPVDNGKNLYPDNGVTKGEAVQLISKTLDAIGENAKDDFEKNIEIIQTVKGNVFLRSEKIDIGIATGTRLFGWEVRGYYGDILMRGYAKTKNGQAMLNFDYLDLGHYSLKIFAVDENGIRHELGETFFGILADYDFMQVDHDDSPYGINTSYYLTGDHWDPKLTAELAYRMGARNIRDGCHWIKNEPEKGKYVVFQPETVDIFNSYGMTELFATFCGCEHYDNGGTPWTDEGIQAFANYINALYDIYDGHIHYVDVYNEYWAPRFGDMGGSLSEADSLPINYYRMAKIVWETVKPNFPESKLGLVVGNSTTYKDWTEELFGYGGLNYGDYIQYHVYTSKPESDIKADVDFLNATMEKYGKKTPIWLTETGNHTATQANGLTLRQQGNLIPRIYAVSFANGIEKVYIYNLMNNGLMQEDNEDNFGLVHNTISPYGVNVPKEGYVTYAVSARQLTDVKFSEDKSKDGIIHYVFTNDDRKVELLYSLEETSVALLTDKPVKITDIVGKVKTYEPLNGKIYLDLCSDMLYLEGDFEVEKTEMPMGINVENAAVGTDAELTFEPKGELKNIDIYGKVDNDTFKVVDNYVFNAPEEVRKNEYIIDLENEGRAFARMHTTVQFSEVFHIETAPEYKATEDAVECVMNITVANNSRDAVNVEGISYKMEDVEGVYETNKKLAAGESASLSFTLADIVPGERYDVELRVIRDGIVSQKPDYSGKLHYNRMYKEPMPIGKTTAENKANALHIQPDAFDYVFVGDRDRKIASDIWISYDDEYLYVRAEVEDDVNHNQQAERNIWNGDCMQIDFTNERYRFDTQPKVYWEYGFSLTTSGPSGWVWTATNGLSGAAVEKASPGTKYNITRDEKKMLTTYEVQIPWEDVAPITKPTKDDALCMAIVFNEGDGYLRDGWTTWGLGVAETKNPAKYNVLEVIN